VRRRERLPLQQHRPAPTIQRASCQDAPRHTLDSLDPEEVCRCIDGVGLGLRCSCTVGVGLGVVFRGGACEAPFLNGRSGHLASATAAALLRVDSCFMERETRNILPHLVIDWIWNKLSFSIRLSDRS
jgi:hypothetical protein